MVPGGTWGFKKKVVAGERPASDGERAASDEVGRRIDAAGFTARVVRGSYRLRKWEAFCDANCGCYFPCGVGGVFHLQTGRLSEEITPDGRLATFFQTNLCLGRAGVCPSHAGLLFETNRDRADRAEAIRDADHGQRFIPLPHGPRRKPVNSQWCRGRFRHRVLDRYCGGGIRSEAHVPATLRSKLM